MESYTYKEGLCGNDVAGILVRTDCVLIGEVVDEGLLLRRVGTANEGHGKGALTCHGLPFIDVADGIDAVDLWKMLAVCRDRSAMSLDGLDPADQTLGVVIRRLAGDLLARQETVQSMRRESIPFVFLSNWSIRRCALVSFFNV